MLQVKDDCTCMIQQSDKHFKMNWETRKIKSITCFFKLQLVSDGHCLSRFLENLSANRVCRSV